MSKPSSRSSFFVARNISKRIDGVPILHDVSFELDQGEVVGLVGPNGAGKTTLMRILAGIYRPSSGDASILGFPVGSPPARRAISLMPEVPELYPGLSVREHVQFLDRLNLIPREHRHPETEELARYALAQMVDALPHELSQGMKRKLALVLALRKGAELLLLDEPFNGLDPVASSELRLELRQLADRGVTVLVSMHGLRELEEFADRVIFLKHGRICKIAPLEDRSAPGGEPLETLYLRIMGTPGEPRGN